MAISRDRTKPNLYRTRAFRLRQRDALNHSLYIVFVFVFFVLFIMSLHQVPFPWCGFNHRTEMFPWTTWDSRASATVRTQYQTVSVSCNPRGCADHITMFTLIIRLAYFDEGCAWYTCDIFCVFFSILVLGFWDIFYISIFVSFFGYHAINFLSHYDLRKTIIGDDTTQLPNTHFCNINFQKERICLNRRMREESKDHFPSEKIRYRRIHYI